MHSSFARRHLCRTLLSLLVLVGAGCDGTAGGGIITPEELGSVFVRRSVCQGSAIGTTLATIVAGSDGQAADGSSEIACGRSAETCESFLACTGVDTAIACDPAMSVIRCEGDALVDCDFSGFERRHNCNGDENGNTMCIVDDSSLSRCALEAACAEPGLSCEDNYIVFCGSGARYRRDDCTLSGRTCVTNGDRAACVDRAETCTVDLCEGDVFLSCLAGGLGYQATSCIERIGGGACMRIAGEAQCVNETGECTDGEAMCAGTVLRHCVDTRWIDFDCGTFIGATCVEDTTGANPVYRCTSDAWPP